MTRKAARFLVLAALALVSASATTRSRADSENAADDATRIMDEMFRWTTQGKRLMRMQMTISDQSGAERLRMAQVRAMRVEDVRRTLLVIDSPADSRGVGLMTLEHDDLKQPGERWLYLPNLGRSTRIAQTQMSGAFMGSDFSYGELSGPNPKLFAFTLVNPAVTIDGEECWLIGAKPVDANAERTLGYKAAEFWVIKNKMAVIRIRAQLVDGKTKYIRGSDFRLTGKQWHAHRVEARTVAGEKLLSKTVLQILSLDTGDNVVSEADFTKQRLEQGGL